MRCLFVCVLLAAVGCSQAPKAELLTIDKVPDNLMTIAREKLPGVTFDQAVRKSNGIYEIIGKDERGKVREIELSPGGDVVEIE
ncbi:MAG: hypothetical protein HY290_10430 [Planctomycetia bacterium]|nr:hypothetical protein [Planctomycetia bacterium]